MMHRPELTELSTFLDVARQLSFRRAAVARGVASSAVSHAIRSLEERVGVRLFHRTTRSVSLTEAGERLFAELRPAFEGIDRALDALNAYRDTPFGTVKLNVPNSAAPFVLRGILGPLLRQNPGLQLDVVATDRLIDIVEEGFDAGIRLGERLSQDMVAVRIKPRVRFAVVGSPAYFDGRAIPRVPGDLPHHVCIRYRFPSGAMLPWEFERGGEAIEVDVAGPVTLVEQELMVEAALQGCGLAYVWDFRVQDHIASGKLVRCLEDWCPHGGDFYIYYSSRRHVSAGLRALIGLLRA